MNIKALIIPAFVVLVSLQGCIAPLCGCSPPPTNRDHIVGRWSSNNVSLDDQNVTSDWQDFKLQFDWENYTTESSNDENVWPEAGNYEFTADGNLNVVERSDGQLINIVFLNENELSLSFTRANSGLWEFNFNRIE